MSDYTTTYSDGRGHDHEANTYPACQHCGHPVPPEGVSLPHRGVEDIDVVGQGRPRCTDTACTC